MSFALKFVRGDNRTLTVTLTNVNDQPYPWAGCKLWFTAKRDAAQADDDAVISKTSGGGGITFPADGTATITIDAADTADLPNRSTSLVCDVQLLTAAGDIHTVDEGRITVGHEITLGST